MNTTLQPQSADVPRQGRTWRSRLLRWLVVLGVCYAGVLIVLLALENWLVYHPTSATQEWWPPPGDAVQDVEFTSADGNRIHAWWCPCQGARGALLYCHGNAGNLSHRAGSIAALQKVLRENVLIFDYPGYGRSSGKPSEAGCYQAADAAYDWLVVQKHIRPKDILIYGGSLGGGVAVDLASRKPHRALVLLRTFTSAPDVAQKHYPWLPVRWLMRNRFDNLKKIGRCRQPVFIAHGTSDRLIPYEQGRRLFAAANEPRCFYPMEGADHNDAVPAPLFEALHQFLAKAEASSPARP
jgi:fermentation-respiration switch protein FrsA (DUF1100 family)